MMQPSGRTLGDKCAAANGVSSVLLTVPCQADITGNAESDNILSADQRKQSYTALFSVSGTQMGGQDT